MIKRQIDPRGQYRFSVVEIKSARLRDVLLDINKGVEDIELGRAEPGVCPFHLCWTYLIIGWSLGYNRTHVLLIPWTH